MMRKLRIGDVYVSRSGKYRIAIEAIRGSFCTYSVLSLKTNSLTVVTGSSLHSMTVAMNSPYWTLETLDMENE
jgi:hypothetical protein